MTSAMKVGIFNLGDVGSPHLETQLEFVEEHATRGDTVYLFGCRSELPTCARNLRHDLYICGCCIARRQAGESLVSKHVIKLPLVRLSEHDRLTMARLKTDWEDAGSLEEYEFDGFEVGSAVLGLLVSDVRDPELNPHRHRQILRDMLLSACAIYLSALNWIEALGLQVVYVQCGRAGTHRAVLRACATAGVECRVHERGHSPNTYGLWVNAMPHTIAYAVQRMRECWENSNPELKRARGAAYFENKVKGSGFGWYSYVKAQQSEALPAGWDTASRNVAVYTSSEDEFLGLGDEYRNPIYSDCAEGVRAIARGLAVRGAGIRLYVRMHPHQRLAPDRVTSELRQMQEPNVTIIAPESNVSSYAMMQAAEKVLTFGSTVGIEAVYWGKPSILAGKAIYQDLGATYNAKTHDEVLDLVCSRLAPNPSEPALVYGNYYSSFGLPFKYYQGEDYVSGTFKGVDLSIMPTPARKYLSMVSSIRGAHFVLRWLGTVHRWLVRRRLRNHRPLDSGFLDNGTTWSVGKQDGKDVCETPQKG